MSSGILEQLGVKPSSHGASDGTWIETGGKTLVSHNPTDGEPIAEVTQATVDDYEKVIGSAQKAFATWRMVPAPVAVGPC